MSEVESLTAKILIVDKDSKYIEQFIDMCRANGDAQIDTTNSYDRALELIAREGYQLVIADSSVGEVNSLSLLERLKTISPTTSIIVTSAYATVEEAVKVIRIGADEYIRKPINQELFKIAIKRAFERRNLFKQDRSVSALLHLLNACQLISFFTEEEKVLEIAGGYLKSELSPKMAALYHIRNGIKTRMKGAVDRQGQLVDILLEGNNYINIMASEGSQIKIFEKKGIVPEVVVFKFKCAHPDPFYLIIVSPTWSLSFDEILSRNKLLTAQVEITGKNIQSYKGMRHLLFLDEPSGLFNTRYLHISLDQCFDQWKNDNSKYFSILFIDVDKFKTINDKYGHLLGTKILFEVAQVFNHILTKGDSAYRYGGDEFVIILKKKNPKEAKVVAEKLRSLIENHIFLSKENLNIRITISVGVAACPEHAVNKKQVIEAADHAMYEAKRSSRNAVFVTKRKAA